MPNTQSFPAPESTALALLTAVEDIQVHGGTYSVHGIADVAGVPETTARRWLHPDFTETITVQQLLDLRTADVLFDGNEGHENLTTYAVMLSNATPIMDDDGTLVAYEVNTSRFNLLVNYGAKFGFAVHYEPMADMVWVERQTDADRAAFFAHSYQ